MDPQRPPDATPPGEPARLIAPVERERVIAVLRDAFATDVIGVDDYEARVSAAYAARTTGDLERLTRDLPMKMQDLPDARSTTVEPRRRAAVAPATGSVIHAVFSSVTRAPAVMPERQEIQAVFGNVELDLTTTAFPDGIAEIHVVSALGNIELTLPWDADVENAGSAVLGNFDVHVRTKRSGLELPDRPRIRITGYAVLGNVEVRTAPRPKS